MKKSNRSIRHEGFTLVELLIVIVVIGILSAMMMLSSTEAVSSAKASNIVSNLRNLKTAALSWYIDSMDEVEKSTFTLANTTHLPLVKKYLSNGNADLTGYEIVADSSKKWYIKYSGGDMSNASVVNKLEARRKSVGLFNANNSTKTADNDKLTTSTGVFMLVR